MSRRQGRRPTDRALLALLFLLNVGSAYTTVLGAREVLPSPMADIIGLSIQVMLFLTLAGVAARHAVLRKWLVVGVFAAASIYTSFFAYYQHLAGAAAEAGDLDRSHQAHASFVSDVYQPTLSRVGRLEQEASTLYDLAQREGTNGVTTGQVGFGPVAKEYASQARAKELEATTLRADLDRLSDRFEYEVSGLSADEVYGRDLVAWQTAPDEWKADTPPPKRADYLDLEQQISLLAPYYKVSAGELPAVVALLLALLVDGVCILLGTAIQGRGQPVIETVSRGAAGIIEAAKDGGAQVRAAWHRPGVAGSRLPLREVESLEETVQVVVLRIAGRGSDFLSAFYQAIHPETGALDFAGLQSHDNATFRIAARMLADRLRRPKLGWVEVREGWWCVPKEHYASLTSWLGDQIKAEVEAETEVEEQPRERTLELVLPAQAA